MGTQTRKERERAEREKLIVNVAQRLAEEEGWDAVTTRRLAAEIEYSQPVLYSHFKGRDAIRAAVAVEGCAQLAARLRTARESEGPAVAAVAAAYAAFAEEHPALYDAIFTLSVDLPFATPEAPAPLRAAFGELRETVRPLAGNDDLEVLTETFWAGLHGLLTLMRNGRLLPGDHERRLALFVSRFSDRA